MHRVTTFTIGILLLNTLYICIFGTKQTLATPLLICWTGSRLLAFSDDFQKKKKTLWFRFSLNDL